MSVSRVVFLGTPDFAAVILEKMVLAGFAPVGVVSQPDRPAGRKGRLRPPPVKGVAEAHGLPLAQPRRVRKGRLAARLREWDADLAVVAAYGRILPKRALAAPRLGCVNVHASLLPAYRGAAPIHRAILNGEPETGVCLMAMEAGLDTGPVYACRRTPITPEDTAETLHDRLAAIGAELLVDALPDLLAGRLIATPQDHDRATLAPPLKKEEGCLDWDRPATALRDQVRGLFPWPGAFTWLSGRRLKVFPPVEPVARFEEAAPGTVLAAGADGIVVACGEGALRLHEVQAENRRRMAAAAFLAGHALTAGTRLSPS